jgi:hypothetical protein
MEEAVRQVGRARGAPQVTHIVVVGFHHQMGPKVIPPHLQSDHNRWKWECWGAWVGRILLTCFANKVEFVYPPLTDEDGPREEKSGLPAAWENLPFLALPDGVHRSGTSQHSPRSCGHTEGERLIAMIAEEDHSYFTLPPLQSQRPQIGLLYGVSCFRQVHVSVRAYRSSLLFICVGPAPAPALASSLIRLCPLVVARQLRSLHAHAGPEDCLCTYERRTIPTSRV